MEGGSLYNQSGMSRRDWVEGGSLYNQSGMSRKEWFSVQPVWDV